MRKRVALHLYHIPVRCMCRRKQMKGINRRLVVVVILSFRSKGLEGTPRVVYVQCRSESVPNRRVNDFVVPTENRSSRSRVPTVLSRHRIFEKPKGRGGGYCNGQAGDHERRADAACEKIVERRCWVAWRAVCKEIVRVSWLTYTFLWFICIDLLLPMMIKFVEGGWHCPTRSALTIRSASASFCPLRSTISVP